MLYVINGVRQDEFQNVLERLIAYLREEGREKGPLPLTYDAAIQKLYFTVEPDMEARTRWKLIGEGYGLLHLPEMALEIDLSESEKKTGITYAIIRRPTDGNAAEL